MEPAGRPRPLLDAGLRGPDLYGMGRRPAGQPRGAGDPQGRHCSIPAVLGALPLKLKVLYFASVKERLEKGAEEIDVPADVSTVGALRAHLGTRGGRYAEVFADRKLVRAAVNQDMVPLTA